MVTARGHDGLWTGPVRPGSRSFDGQRYDTRRHSSRGQISPADVNAMALETELAKAVVDGRLPAAPDDALVAQLMDSADAAGAALAADLLRRHCGPSARPGPA